MAVITTKSISIYITNLGKYNEGELIGEWVNLPATGEELDEVYNRIGINEEYEEVFITDYETDIDGLEIGEYDDILELNEIAKDLETLDGYDLEKIGAIIEAHGLTLRESIDDIDDYTYYSGMTLEDLAYDLVEEMNLPEFAQRYFDYEAYARDLGFD